MAQETVELHEGWNLSAGVFKLVVNDVKVAEVSGAADITESTFAAAVEVSGTTIIIKDKNLFNGTNAISVVSDTYKLAVDASLNSLQTKPEELTWTVNATTATGKGSMSNVYVLASDGKSVSKKSNQDIHVTVSGLKSGVTADVLNATGNDAVVTVDEDVIKLDTSILPATGANVTIETDLMGVVYELGVDGEHIAETEGRGWYRAANNGKAVYRQDFNGEKNDYYSTGTAIKQLTKAYTEEKPFSLTYATVSGLGKENSAWEGTDVSNEGITVEGKKIKISQDLLDAGTDKIIKESEEKGVKKLTLGKNDDFEFVFDEEVQEPTDDAAALWNLGYKTKNEEDTGTGTWTYTLGTSGGWDIVADKNGKNKTISYVAAKTTTLATISGLTTDLDFILDKDDLDEPGEYSGKSVKVDNTNVISVDGTTITLNKAAFGGKKITLKTAKGGTDYKLALASDYGVKDIDPAEAKWVVNKSGKAVLTGGKTEGYTLATDGKSINYTKAAVTPLATISGLGKNLTDAKITELEGYLNASDVTTTATYTETTTGEGANATKTLATKGIIRLTNNILKYAKEANENNLGKLKVTLGNKDDYEFDMSGVTTDKSAITNGKWEIENTGTAEAPKYSGKATYKASVSTGFSLSGDSKTVNYVAEAGPNTLVTLSGLDKTKLTDKVVDNDGKLALKGGTNESPSYTNLITVADNKITLLEALKTNELITSKVSIKNANGSSFALALGTGLGQEDTNGAWDVSKGTAVYASGKKPGYELDTKETTATYKSSASNTMLAKVTGLAKTATTADISVGTGEDEGKIIVGKDALGTSNVTLINGTGQTYTLKLGDGVATSDTATNYWTIGNGKATYANGKPAYYKLNDTSTSITYSKAGSATTLAAVTGLNKEVKSTDVVFDPNDSTVIVIKEGALPYATTDTENNLKKTKIALKGDGYKLALDSELTSSKAATTDAWGTPDKGKVLLERTVSTAGFVVTDTSVTYGEVGGKTTLATLSGVKAAPADAPNANGVINIASAQLNEKKATLKGDGYSLKLTDGAPTVKSLANGEAGAWNTKSGTATLSGKTNAGYLQTDPNTITYVKALGTDTKDVAIATIKGVKAVDFDETESTTTGESQDAVTTTTGKYVSYADSTMTFTNKVGDALSTNITVDGKGVVKFNFAAYSDASITGSANADNFTFGGTGLTITPGKGADYVKLGTTTRGEGKADTFVYASGDGYDEVADFTTGDSLKINKAKKIEVTHDKTNTYVNVDGKGTITLDAFEYSGINISGAASASLMSSGNDLDSDTTGIQDILAVPSTGYTGVNFDKDFTLSKTSAFNATISFTKKTSGDGD